MDRRRFLKLFASAVSVTATNPVHFLAPKNGWRQSPAGIYSFSNVNGFVLNNGIIQSNWHSKTPEEIMRDFDWILRNSSYGKFGDVPKKLRVYA